MKSIGIALFFLLTASAMADKTIQHYDKHGRYTGKVVVKEKERRYFDKHGRYLGKEVLSGDTVRRYDAKGRPQGSYKCPNRLPCWE